MNRIRQLRVERQLSQEELGQFVEKTKHAISKWEGGVREPSQDDLDKLCTVLGATSDYLLGRTDVNTRRIELSGEQIPKNLRDAGLDYVLMLKEYIDANGGILPDVQRELLRLVAEAKLLQEGDAQKRRPRKSPNKK